jgi:DNA-binding CsgD family transcriptional regulator
MSFSIVEKVDEQTAKKKIAQSTQRSPADQSRTDQSPADQSQNNQSQNNQSQNNQSPAESHNDAAGTNDHWLRSIVEHWTDGVLILTVNGDWIYTNAIAQQICNQLSNGQPTPGTVPRAVWQVCQLLLSTRGAGKGSPIVLESEVVLKSTSHYRVRVQWLHLAEATHEDATHEDENATHATLDNPYLLVTLEDCYQAMQNRAIAEAQQYHLTSRQSEVWLLYRTGHSYRDIATHLYVTLNTVKRHMKDIYAKQKNLLSMGQQLGDF